MPADVDVLKGHPLRRHARDAVAHHAAVAPALLPGVAQRPPLPGRKTPPGLRDGGDAALEPDSDVHAIAVDRVVAVTPLTLDLTSRVELAALQALLQRPI